MNLTAGDVYYADLDPIKGTEQRGTRPVIVVSVANLGPRAIVVPMTTTLRAWATRIPVTLHGIRAEALCEQVRSIDIVRLNEELYGRINPETLVEIQEIIARLIGVYTASGPLLT